MGTSHRVEILAEKQLATCNPEISGCNSSSGRLMCLGHSLGMQALGDRNEGGKT